MCFVDSEKGCNSTNGKGLWFKMTKIEASENITNHIKTVH